MKKILYFDIETDGLDATKVHCLGLYNPISNVSKLFHGEHSVAEGIKLLKSADIICGHNVINFDCPVLKRLYGFSHNRIIDTLVMSRVIHPNLYDLDLIDAPNDMPKKLYGSQGLKAWGYRLGEHKDEIETDWLNYTKEMGEYCVQDVMVTFKLHRKLLEQKTPASCILLEHQFAHIMQSQMERGFAFNMDKAEDLVRELMVRRTDVESNLQKIFPPIEEETKSATGWTVDVDGQTVSAKTKGQLKLKLKELGLKQVEANRSVRMGNKVNIVPFNPSSRVQIEQRFREKYDWNPKIKTPNGRAKIDEGVLKTLDFEEAPVLLEYLMIQKRLSQIAEGNEAWLKLAKDGRIYGRINTNGAITGRCTHSRPNIAQVPAHGSDYGENCRELFEATDGFSLIGCDASGLELRCLGHYLSRFDGGSYAREVVNGDIHTLNQTSAGLPNRDEAKKFIYAYLYGAGDELIGKIVGGGSREGKAIKKRFLEKTPALARLKKAIEIIVETKKYLTGLDGRKLYIRSQHSALNTLLQSAGAVIMKKATVNLNLLLTKHKIQAFNVAHIHDEIQIETREEDSERVGKIAVHSIRKVTEDFKLKCQLDGEFKIGKNWKETH